MPDVLPSTRKLTLGELNLNLIANILVALVAALHAYFLILEMFLWLEGLSQYAGEGRDHEGDGCQSGPL